MEQLEQSVSTIPSVIALYTRLWRMKGHYPLFSDKFLARALVLRGQQCGFDPAAHLQLLQDVGDVMFDGFL